MRGRTSLESETGTAGNSSWISARFLLVYWIHEREQIADGDRLDAGGLELAHRAANGVPVELPQDASGVIAALGNLLGEALVRDSWRLGIEIIEQVAVARR